MFIGVIIRLEGRRVAYPNSDKSQDFYFCEKQLHLIDHGKNSDAKCIIHISINF